MAQMFAAFVVVSWVAWVPVADAGALRGQQAFSIADKALAPLGLTLTESGSTAEVEERVANMTEALRPVFLALPRSAEGYLEASAVRYLLHRYFVDRDGWFVQGADASGEAASNSLPEVVLKGGALAGLLSERLAARGLSLREVAVLAAALETLASSETVQRLHAAYRIVGLSHREDSASEPELSLILDVYMQMYTLGFEHEAMNWKQVNETWKKIYKVYPMWDDFKKWVRQVRLEVLTSIPAQRSTFDGQVRALEELQHLYGRWQDQECLLIKEALLQHVTPGTGRIPLSTFYAAALPGGWKPSESRGYLEHMGALDETDPSNPSVVIPNYFDTGSNCAKPSRYYQVCCISECEALLGQLERKLGSPDALPQRIVEIVENLNSTTVDAPRTLPAQLVERLESVAEMHGGHAPMHGRLFRQWMHHAFPAECSFPALSTKQPMSAYEWARQTGQNATIDLETLQWHLEDASKKMTSAMPQPVVFEVDALASSAHSDPLLPWSDEEELYIVCSATGAPETVRAPVPPKSLPAGLPRGALLLAIAACMAVAATLVRAQCRPPKNSLLPYSSHSMRD